MNDTIFHHPSFQNCNGQLLVSLIAGSTLYGLNNKDSDVDYRGIFLATDQKYTTGFDTIESICQTGDVDSTYYELLRYLKLLRKSNTQVLEILFAEDSDYNFTTPIFDEIRANRYSLIDTHILKASLKGYVYSEIKLATGQRTGRLGGKRKEALDRNGYSPKNMVQLLRLCEVGRVFFTEGLYMVKVKDFNPKMHEVLMEIKNHPENFTCDQLSHMVDVQFKKLEEVMESSLVSFNFNVDLASDIVIRARERYKL